MVSRAEAGGFLVRGEVGGGASGPSYPWSRRCYVRARYGWLVVYRRSVI